MTGLKNQQRWLMQRREIYAKNLNYKKIGLKFLAAVIFVHESINQLIISPCATVLSSLKSKIKLYFSIPEM